MTMPKYRKLINYEQDIHCCGRPYDLSNDEPATFRARVEDGGGGPYVVLDVDEWALDSVEEFDALISELRELIKTCEVTSDDGTS